jgi:5'-3' exonuclease
MLKNAPLFGIKTINVKGAEADDTIAFLINNIDLTQWQIMLLSSDTDLHQLLRPGVVQGTYGKEMASGLAKGRVPASIFKTYDDYRKEFDIFPKEYALAKSLSGDTSDSIKGFDLIGPKISLELIKKYKTFENIQRSLDTLSAPRLSKRSVEHMRNEFEIVHRNFKLINLNWDREGFTEILGEDGVEKLVNFISEIPTPELIDRDQITELCYEYGRVDIVEQLDFWVHTFGGRL